MSTSFEDIGTQAPHNPYTNTVPQQNPGLDRMPATPNHGGGSGDIVGTITNPERVSRIGNKFKSIVALGTVGAVATVGAVVGVKAGFLPNPFENRAIPAPENFDDNIDNFSGDMYDNGVVSAEDLNNTVEVTDDMTPKEFFALPDETRVAYYADELEDARAAAREQMNSVENLTPVESKIINEPRPKDKSAYTTSMVFAEISEGIYGAGMIADMDGFRADEPPRVNEALKMHSAVVDPSSFNADELIEQYHQITIRKDQGGRGPGLYITEVMQEYEPIHGGNFMGYDLGNNEARVAVVKNTRRDGGPVPDGRVTTNLAVLTKDGWLSLGALEAGPPKEGSALQIALAELSSN